MVNIDYSDCVMDFGLSDFEYTKRIYSYSVGNCSYYGFVKNN